MTRDGKKIAVSAGCMDRPGPLAASLASWANLREADHIVVVDWSSREPLRTTTDPRVLVVRVNGQKFWRNSLCHNLEITVASELRADLLLRVDADVVVRPDFFQAHPAEDKAFYAVDCHMIPPALEHKKSLCGTVYARLTHALRVNGYNERLRQYGYEDEDFFKRLEASGLKWKRCNLDTLHHIPHSDAMRIEHLDTGDAPAEVRKKGTRDVVEHYVYKSLHLATTNPWGPRDQRVRWTISRPAPNYWEASPCA